MAHCSTPFLSQMLALPLTSFYVRRECKINVSACERYTISCGIPSIQNTQIDLAEVARCTLLVSLLIAVFVNRVGVFLEHMHRTLKASERFSTNFPMVSLYFTCLLALVVSTTTAATITSNLNRSLASSVQNHSLLDTAADEDLCKGNL